MADDGRNTLLKKEYYENCPGCKVDRLKERQRGIPFKEFSYIWLVSLCSALPIQSLFPFIYFMVRDFHIAKREEDIGFYAGFIGSSFMIGRALTSIFWGVVADRYGRKPVILIGIISVVLFNTLFGFSTSFWMALSMRFLLGCFSSLLGSTRAYASEVCREEYRALGQSVASTSRGIGLIVGPAIGGFFAQPADKYPSIFSENSLFGRFPYLLPCLLISVFAAGILVACIWLPETLHMHNGKASSNKLGETRDMVKIEGRRTSNGNLFKNWSLMSTIIVYCVFHSMRSPIQKKYGGLSFSSQEVGEVLAISGFGLLLFQLLLYQPVEKLVGPIMVTRLAAILSIPLLSSYPYMAKLSGITLQLIINCASILKNALSVSIVTGLIILQNNAVPQHQRGAANGISMTAMSVFKSFGPAGGGALFSWAQRRQVADFLPGDQMVFFALNLILLIGLLLTFKPFFAQPDEDNISKEIPN